MRVVVTGGSGFCGSHIVDSVIEAGHVPIIIDNLSGGVDYTREGVERYMDTIGVDTISGVLASCDAIIHAAAYADLRQNWRDKAERDRLLHSNVLATIALIEQSPAVPIVTVSTAAVYGARTKEDPVTECDATAETMQSPYAASKFATEAYVASYAYARNHRWYAVRLVNLVGSRSTHGVAGDFVRMAKQVGHIHAADTGVQRKSWVHVKDAADAMVKMVTTDQIPSGVYSITSEERISWWQIIEEMGWPKEKVTYEARDRGAVGDPFDLSVSGKKLAPWFECKRSVRDGIRDALKDLGWGT